MTIETAHLDRRIKRTRTAILDAFFELVLSEKYDDIQVNHIIKKANIGRSTFYEHFDSKNDLLGQSLQGPMQTLAMACTSEDNTIVELKVPEVLDHFWSNRIFARQIFGSDARKQIADVLCSHVLKHLEKHTSTTKQKTVLPKPMHAMQITQAQLAIIIPWLTTPSGVKSATVAQSLMNSSQALINASFHN